MKKYSYLLVATAFMLQMGTSLAMEDNQQTAVFSPQVAEEQVLTYTATYVDKMGNTVHAPYIAKGVKGTSYSAPKEQIEGYELIGIDYANGNPSGILEYDGLSSRFIYSKVEVKNFTFTATYVDQATGAEISPAYVVSDVEGTAYSAPKKAIEGYELIGIDYANGKPSGILEYADSSVKFIYSKIVEVPEETEGTEQSSETEGTETTEVPEGSQVPEETTETEAPGTTETTETEEAPGTSETGETSGTESQTEQSTETEVANNGTGSENNNGSNNGGNHSEDPGKSSLTSVNNDAKKLPQTGEKSTVFVTVLGSLMTAVAFVVGYRKFK